MRLLPLALVLLTFGSTAYAQRQDSAIWLEADAIYTDITYTEAAQTEKGQFAGARGALGLNLSSGLGISAGGEYMDGHMGFAGTTMTGAALEALTKDYLSDRYALLNFYYGGFSLSGGVGQREWLNDVVGGFRRREIYSYYPVRLMVLQGSVYLKLQVDIWNKGTNKSYMSDLSTAEKDVTFNQTSGSGYGGELGLLVPTALHYLNRIFIAYHHWEVADSDAQNDNVHNLTAVKNSTNVLQAGIGLSF